MSQYKPYQAYQETAVEWIGKLPKRWSVARIKRHATLRSERCTEVPAGTTYIGLEDVEPETGKYKPTPGNSRQSEDSTVGTYRDLDVLYGKLRPYLRKSIVASGNGVCSTEFLVLHTESLDPNWLHQWLLTPVVTQQIEAGCDGAKMPRADWEHVGSIPIPVPSKDEQTEIIKSMAEEAARIDALISKKSRFIELLNEKRQALITLAVTKGVNPKNKMKPSGSNWIGDVPDHWTPMRFGRIARVTGGLVDPRDEPYRSMLLIAPNHIESGTGRILGLETASEQNAESGKYTFKAGTVIYSKIRPALAKVAIAPCDGLCSADMYPLECTGLVERKWLFYLMLSRPFTAWATLESDRVAMPKINRESLADLSIHLPPREEQALAVQFIESNLPKVDALATKVQESIDLLKERRSAFITAAVTGQIDLREAA